MPTTFVDLQNGWYNTLTQGLGLSASSFQILQPSPPLVANDNTFLWAYFNNIPPLSLTGNYIVSGGNQFFSDYETLIGSLQAPVSHFEQDIGEAVFNSWMTFLAQLPTTPAVNQLPQMFRNWAIFHAPQVANRGAADLSALLLDPISRAGLGLMPYQGDPLATPPVSARPPDWSLGYSQLIQQLRNAPKQSFHFDTHTMNTDVSRSWAHSEHSGLFGLWGGSSSQSNISSSFASSSLTVDASFAHVLTFFASPGPWYDSSAMGIAYSHKTGSPWTPGSLVTWNDTFDPTQGNLARFMVNLIVVDTMNVTVQARTTFSSADQQTIHNNSGAGLWPFYTASSSSGASSTITFDRNGGATIQISTLPGVPIVLGGNVLPVDQYVGHAVTGSRLVRELPTGLARDILRQGGGTPL